MGSKRIYRTLKRVVINKKIDIYRHKIHIYIHAYMARIKYYTMERFFFEMVEKNRFSLFGDASLIVVVVEVVVELNGS